jgi:hypothetical protein
MDNFRLVLRKQTDKRQNSVCTANGKHIKKNGLRFHFPFEMAAYI